MTFGDPGDDVGEISLGLDAAELAGFDERGDDGPVLGAAVGAGEQGILAGEHDRPDGPLDGVGVDLDSAVVDEPAQPVPAGEDVADCFGELGLLADPLQLVSEPGLEGVEDRSAVLLSGRAAFIGRLAADAGLDAVEYPAMRSSASLAIGAAPAAASSQNRRRACAQQKASVTAFLATSAL